LIKALAACGAEAPRVVFVTQGAQPVSTEPEMLNVAQATLWGLGRVLGLELPELRHMLVDLEPEPPDTSVQKLFDLLTENSADDDQLAIRRGARFDLRIVPRATADRQPLTTIALEPEATYLVTGGFAGLGLLVAKWLVDRGARQLVLLARSHPTGAAIDAIAAMEDTGATVVPVQADVSDYDQLVAALSTIDFEDKPLRGVIHSAGVLDDGTLLQLDWDRFQRVMYSKVDGSWNLHKISRQHVLDFFVLFSSGASFTGSPGQGNHAAANAFMDALAFHRQALSLPGLSINWGPWSEVGAAERTGVVARAKTKGLKTIEPAQGLQVLEHILGSEAAQVAVLPLTPLELVQNRPNAARACLYEELAGFAQPDAGAEPTATPSSFADQLLPQLLSASPGKRAVLMSDLIQQQAIETMGLDSSESIDPGRPLTDLGLDSLMAVELRNVIAKWIGKSLPATILFNYPSINQLTTHLLQDVLAADLGSNLASAQASDVAQQVEQPGVKDDAFDELSEEEIEGLLQAELGEIGDND
jgi:acyl carrier protein